jgi:hypothetical protein
MPKNVKNTKVPNNVFSRLHNKSGDSKSNRFNKKIN